MKNISLSKKWHYLSVCIAIIAIMLLFSVVLWGPKGLYFGFAFSGLILASLLIMKLLDLAWFLLGSKWYKNLENLKKFNLILTNIAFLLGLIFIAFYFPNFMNLSLMILVAIGSFLILKFASKRLRDCILCGLLILGNFYLLFWIYVMIVTWYAVPPNWQANLM